MKAWLASAPHAQFYEFLMLCWGANTIFAVVAGSAIMAALSGLLTGLCIATWQARRK